MRDFNLKSVFHFFSEFKNTKACLLKIPTDAGCIGAEELIHKQQVMHGNYNPFCPSGIDEDINGGGSQGSGGATTKSSPVTSRSAKQESTFKVVYAIIGSVAVLMGVFVS